MTLVPYDLQQYSEKISREHGRMADRLFEEVVKRLQVPDGNLSHDEVLAWKMKKLAEMGLLTKAIERAMVRFSKRNEQLVAKLIKNAHEQAVIDTQEQLNEDVSFENDDEVIKGNYQRYVDNSAIGFKGMHQTMAQKAQNLYLRVLNAATTQTQTGQTELKPAVYGLLVAAAGLGIVGKVDRAGRNWQPETYSGMIAKAVANDTYNDTEDKLLKEVGHDLVIISSHPASRPTHYDYQNNVYSLSGTDDEYPPLSDTTYGDYGGGLITGVNCRHYKTAYNENESSFIKMYPKELDGELYKLTQRQNVLEADIRRAKRRKMAADYHGTDMQKADAANVLKSKQSTLDGFISNMQKKKDSYIEFNLRPEKTLVEVNRTNIQKGIDDVVREKTKFDPVKQRQHIQGTDEFNQRVIKDAKKGYGPSYFYISEDEVSAIIQSEAAKKPMYDVYRTDNRYFSIDMDRIIGFDAKEGKDSREIKVFYASRKNGMHGFPYTKGDVVNGKTK